METPKTRPKKIGNISKIVLFCTSLLCFSTVALADSPTEIYINVPGNTTLNVPENVQNGDIVGTLQTDADPGDITFFEGAGPNPATARFNVNPNGDIICDNCNLDFETANPLSLPVIAQEPLVTINENINIVVTDVDEAPQFQNFTSFLRYEEQEDNSPIFYSQSGQPIFDQDAGDDLSTLTYNIVSCVDSDAGNCLGLFSTLVENIVDPFAGVIERFQITGPTFDFESGPLPDFYTITIEATDDGGNSSTDSFVIENRNIGEVEDAESPDADGTYIIGDQVTIRANLSDHDTLYYNNNPRDPIGFFDLPAETPTLELGLDTGTVEAELTNLPEDTFTTGTIELGTGQDLNGGIFYDAGAPITALEFTYTVQEGDYAALLDYSNEDAIDMKTATLNDTEFGNDFIGTYYFESGPNRPIVPTDLPTPGLLGSISFNRLITIDGIRPTIDAGSGSGAPTVHAEGDTLNAVVEFSEDLNKLTLDGTSTIDLDIGGTIVTADYDFGYSATLLDNQLGFSYIITNGLFDDDGVDIVENSFNPNIDIIQDIPGNQVTDYNNARFNLANDNVNSLDPVVVPPVSSGGGSSSSNNGSNPFVVKEDDKTEVTQVDETPAEEEDTNVVTPEDEPSEPEQVETTTEQPEKPNNTYTPPTTPTKPVVTEPIPETGKTEENNNVEEEIETDENLNEEPEISFQGSLNVSSNNKEEEKRQVYECEEYNTEQGFTESRSLNCDPTTEYIDEDGAEIQINLSKNITNEYPSDDIVITGQVSDESIKNVGIYASIDGTNQLIATAKVDKDGKFIIRNASKLPLNSDIVIYAKDLDGETKSPQYTLLINQSMDTIGVDLESFVGKSATQMFKSNDENINYWTFVNIKDIENGLLNAKVKSEFKTYHKAFWQSILIGSTAVTGSNSDLTTLIAPEEKLIDIKPFSTHKVTILAERVNAKSEPLVIEYIVLPNGFIPGIVVVLIIIAAVVWYAYNRKRGVVIEEVTEVENSEK